MEKLIRPVEDTWAPIGVTAAAIEDWEKRTGLRLPAVYRTFMRRYNGGHPFPLMFRHGLPTDVSPSGDLETLLDTLYQWSVVEEIWSGAAYGHATPPGMLFIGADIGTLEVLLSVRPEDYGAIYLWRHSLDPWGKGANTRLWPQAGCFSAFMENLYENDAGDGAAHWHEPVNAALERRLEL